MCIFLEYIAFVFKNLFVKFREVYFLDFLSRISVHFEYKLIVTLQQEYIRGISAWNFNLEDLKNQAALVSGVGVFLVFAYFIS